MNLSFSLKVFRMNVFHTSSLLSTLLLTKKVLLSLSMEISTLCTIFSEVPYPKVQIPEGWFAQKKPRTQRLFCSAHYACVVLQHAVTWYACNAAEHPYLTKQNAPKIHASLAHALCWNVDGHEQSGVVRMLKLTIMFMQSCAAKLSKVDC